MLASDPAGILNQIFGRAGIHLTQESTQNDHALKPTSRSNLKSWRMVRSKSSSGANGHRADVWK